MKGEKFVPFDVIRDLPNSCLFQIKSRTRTFNIPYDDKESTIMEDAEPEKAAELPKITEVQNTDVNAEERAKEDDNATAENVANNDNPVDMEMEKSEVQNEAQGASQEPNYENGDSSEVEKSADTLIDEMITESKAPMIPPVNPQYV
jgi:hypothetical protein